MFSIYTSFSTTVVMVLWYELQLYSKSFMFSSQAGAGRQEFNLWQILLDPRSFGTLEGET